VNEPLDNEDDTNGELSPETLAKLDANTLWLVRSDLLRHMRGLEALAHAGVLDKQDAMPRADTLRAMAAHYLRWWEKTRNAKRVVEPESLPKQPKRPRDFMSRAVTLALADRAGPLGATADAVFRRMLIRPAILRLLPRAPTKANVAETLSTGSRGSNPRFIRVKQGLYKNNPNYKKPK